MRQSVTLNTDDIDLHPIPTDMPAEEKSEQFIQKCREIDQPHDNIAAQGREQAGKVLLHTGWELLSIETEISSIEFPQALAQVQYLHFTTLRMI
jgi:hypothetical protein